jgi:hypothetical protein
MLNHFICIQVVNLTSAAPVAVVADVAVVAGVGHVVPGLGLDPTLKSWNPGGSIDSLRAVGKRMESIAVSFLFPFFFLFSVLCRLWTRFSFAPAAAAAVFPSFLAGEAAGQGGPSEKLS